MHHYHNWIKIVKLIKIDYQIFGDKWHLSQTRYYDQSKTNFAIARYC
jgi:hypothetical protein